MYLVVKDSTGQVHLVDSNETQKRTEQLSGDSSIVVSQCNRDVVTELDEAEEFYGDSFSSIPGACPACSRQFVINLSTPS